MVKLFRVSCSISQKEHTVKVTEYDANETAKSYTFKGSYGGRRIDKDRIMHIDTGLRNCVVGWDGDAIQFHTYCTESQVEDAVVMVKKEARSRINDIRNSAVMIQDQSEYPAVVIRKKGDESDRH